MFIQEICDRFATQSPIPVMVSATLAGALSAKKLDQIFADSAQRQRVDELAFSTVVDLMGMVVSRTQKSVHAAYQAHQDNIAVAVKSVYNKLNGIEPRVSAALVSSTAAQLQELIEEMKGELPSIIPGYRVKILDGNHLAATERRIGELRTQRGSPLPGQALVVLDPQRKLMLNVYLSEDGHEQERSNLLQLIEDLEPGDVWIADRNFCTSAFLYEIALNKAFFIIRQHATCAPWRAHGQREYVGDIETGRVFEQSGVLLDDFGNELPVRRVTIELKEATEDGDTELHLLTNLPSAVKATVIALAYRQRWTIEGAYCELTLSLRCEVNTLGYPKAALFGFCLAVVMYNVLSVVKAALRVVHGTDTIETNLSTYYVADEIASVWGGMMIVLPKEYWMEEYGERSVKALARDLLRLAKNVNLRRFQKHSRGPKRPPPKRTNGKEGHVATARVLAASRGTEKC